MAGIGLMIAKGLPPPDKLKKSPAPMADEDAADGGADDAEEGDSEAAELSAMEAFESAEGTADKLAAFKDLISICKPGY